VGHCNYWVSGNVIPQTGVIVLPAESAKRLDARDADTAKVADTFSQTQNCRRSEDWSRHRICGRDPIQTYCHGTDAVYEVKSAASHHRWACNGRGEPVPRSCR